MTKYYYTDSLAAAWMQDKFNMRFCDFDGNEVTLNAFGFIRVYIHPDSLHIIYPREGDLVHAYDMSRDVITHFILGKAPPVGWHLALIGSYKIIQRNNIPFHWPEVEDA